MKHQRSEVCKFFAKRHFLLIGKGGFTLLETLVALAIISIISGAAYSMFSTLNKSYTTQNAASGVQQRLRATIDYMIRDIRMAGLDPIKTAGSGVVSATASSFRFTADKNMDGDTADAAEDVAYVFTGGNLQLTDDQGTETLSQFVTSFLFTYFDRDGVATTNEEDIRSVEISITVREPAGRAKWVSRTYNTRVRCRNLGL